MTLGRIVKSLRATAARFVSAERGNVAMMFAITLPFLITAVGAAVDYSRAVSARTAMQAAADATALMISKEAANLTASEVTTKARAYFNALYTRSDVAGVVFNAAYSANSGNGASVTVSATGTLNTDLMKLAGVPTMPIGVASTTKWGNQRYRVALALDNTGSMASSEKMTNLKTAAHNLLNTLKDAGKQPGDIKVAIVPFAVDVNAGTSNVDATWIDWTDWEAANGNCSNNDYHSKSSCESHGKVWTPKPRSAWNGCVNDRDQNNDVSNTATVAGAPATLFRAHQASACPTSMMPLSEDWTALHAKIDAMTPAGNTNVTIGLSWAFQLLSPNEPFNAPAPAPDLDKVIVLMTDGENTQNRWTSSATSIDARTQKACDNVKAANIKLYTVRVINGDVALLKGCATKASMYYDVQNADQLNNVFSSIAQNLANLRITH
jgi:Flp pilus assembly protein TadG